MRFTAVYLVLIFSLAVPGCGGDKATESSSARSKAAQSQITLVDINSAGKKELMALKGIGETRAQAIIRARPYARKDELVQKGIVPLQVYVEIKDQIVAKQK